MTSRERFDLWAESEAGFAVARYREVAFTGWQARDPEVRELVEVLRDAIDEVENWGAYASEYFQEKHDLSGTVAKLRAILAKHESGGE